MVICLEMLKALTLCCKHAMSIMQGTFDIHWGGATLPKQQWPLWVQKSIIICSFYPVMYIGNTGKHAYHFHTLLNNRKQIMCKMIFGVRQRL